MNPVTYLILAFVLLGFAYLVFRRIVRHDYLERGKLSPFASILQLLVFCGYFFFPYLFNPPEWVWFWRLSSSWTTPWSIDRLCDHMSWFFSGLRNNGVVRHRESIWAERQWIDKTRAIQDK